MKQKFLKQECWSKLATQEKKCNRSIQCIMDTIQVLTIFMWHQSMILYNCHHSSLEMVHVPILGGVSRSEDSGGVNNSILFINFGRVGEKSFKESRQKNRGGGGGRVGDNNILTFLSHCTRQKMPLSCLFLHAFAYSLN